MTCSWNDLCLLYVMMGFRLRLKRIIVYGYDQYYQIGLKIRSACFIYLFLFWLFGTYGTFVFESITKSLHHASKTAYCGV